MLGPDNVVIKDGKIRGFSAGIYSHSNHGLTVRNVDVRGSSFAAVRIEAVGGAKVTGSVLRSVNYPTYVSSTALGTEIANNRLMSTGGAAIFLDGPSLTTVKRNTISSQTLGINVQAATDTTVRGNEFTDIGTSAISLTNDSRGGDDCRQRDHEPRRPRDLGRRKQRRHRH